MVLASRTWPAASTDRPGSVARGRAVVVRALSSVPVLAAGEVLVVERPPASWVPRLGSPTAVVAETGGVLSRPATLLRERGIPAVFGVDGAVGAIRDGDVLEVDPVHGVVCLVGRGGR